MTNELDQDGVNAFDKAVLGASIDSMINMFPEYKNTISIYAALRFHKFKELKNCGFSDEHALHVVCNTPLLG